MFQILLLCVLFILSTSYDIKLQSAKHWESFQMQVVPQDYVPQENDIYRQIDKFHEQINEEIHLEDGRRLDCQIPILIQNQQNNKLKIYNLTENEADNILEQLTNQCTQLEQKFFLWEYCHKNYIKQFDDANTMFNGNKSEQELYYLGHYITHRPKLKNNYVAFNLTKDFKYFSSIINPIESDLFYYDQSAVPLNSSNSYYVQFNFDHDKYNKYIDHDTNLKDKNQTNLNQTIISIKRKVMLIIDNILILEKGFPKKLQNFLINSDQNPHYETQVFQLKNQNSIKVQNNTFSFQLLLKKYPKSYFISHDILMCLYEECNMLAKFKNGQKIQIYNHENQKADEVTIDQIISNKIIILKQFYEEDGLYDIDFIKVIETPNQLALQNKHKENRYPGEIRFYNNIVFGVNTEFKRIVKKKQFVEENDYIQIINQTFQVEKVISNEILLLKQHQNYPNNNDQYEFKIRQIKQNKNMNKVPFQIKFEQWNELMHQNNYQISNQNQLIRFQLNYNDQSEYTQLKFKLKQKVSFDEDIQIYFLSDFKILIRYFNNKKQYTLQSNPYQGDKNITLDFWLTIDQKYIRIGQGNLISYSNQLIKFKYENLQLNYFQISKMESENIVIQNLKFKKMPKKMSNFLQNFDDLDKSQLTQQLKNNTDYDLRYHYEIKDGTVCDKNNQTRSATVELKCSINKKLLEIEKIEEPSYCNYQITIGTSLLCENKQNYFQDKQQNFNKILCRI